MPGTLACDDRTHAPLTGFGAPAAAVNRRPCQLEACKPHFGTSIVITCHTRRRGAHRSAARWRSAPRGRSGCCAAIAASQPTASARGPTSRRLLAAATTAQPHGLGECEPCRPRRHRNPEAPGRTQPGGARRPPPAPGPGPCTRRCCGTVAECPWPACPSDAPAAPRNHTRARAARRRSQSGASTKPRNRQLPVRLGAPPAIGATAPKAAALHGTRICAARVSPAPRRRAR
mmetsp:Transcript_59178/g.180466  ORF Transcript_59178/g.180466 Transcript_59178/m.180466 type:complete len:231 (-) Transcript_59178:616-1308(-)